MIKLTDYIARYINKLPVNCVFGVQGGAVVHIFDSFHRTTDLPVCYTHHEQAAALAAVANAKAHNTIGVCVVTTGPAASNALTGLLAAWQDSTPVIFISGQTRIEQTSYNMEVRQRGSQECNILDVVSPWVKDSYFVSEPQMIVSTLEKAIKECSTGRKGPVWIDLPVNLQWQMVKNESKFDEYKNPISRKKVNDSGICDCIKRIQESKKPLFVLGRPVKETKVSKLFLKKLSDNKIPVVHTWGSCNNYSEKLLNVGIIGMSGQLAANIAVRASDQLIFLGCHFSTTQSGNSYKAFSKSQSANFVNIDNEETANLVNEINSEIILTDVESFMKKFIEISFDKYYSNRIDNWNDFLIEITNLTSPEIACNSRFIENFVNPHLFLNTLYKQLDEADCVVIDGGGTALYAGFQCIPSNSNFNIFCSTSISAMGTGLPELCGASIGKKYKRNFCIIGDGSLMFNLQELQTLKTNCSSATIIVLNNKGYLAIRHTQKEFLDSRFYGTNDEDNQLEIPDIKSISNAFQYSYLKISSNKNINKVINQILVSNKKHLIVELICPPDLANLYTPTFKKNKDGSFTPNDINLMSPFEKFDYEIIAKKYNLDIYS